MAALLIVAAGAVLAFAVLCAATLRLRSRTAHLLALYLAAISDIVLVSQLAGLCRLLDSRLFFLAGHAVLLAAACAWWVRRGRPPLCGPFTGRLARPGGRALRESLRSAGELWLLGAALAAVYGIGVLLVLHVPPNNWDSMSIHMARVGYWLQHGSFEPWPTRNLRQVVYPINAQVQILWTVLFTGSDRLAGLVQWFAALGGAVAVFGIARLLGWSRAGAVFAAALWSAFPEIVLQSTTTQNDLAAAALFACMFYFLVAGVRCGSRKDLLLSGLAMGLALGTKQTILFLVPGLAFTLLGCLVAGRTTVFRRLLTWSGACVAAFFLVGSYMYAVNMLERGHPLGEPGMAKPVTAEESVPRWRKYATNASRYAYQLVDCTGLPDPVAFRLHRIKARFAEPVFAWLDLPVHSKIGTANPKGFSLYASPTIQEDLAWFGPTSVLVLLPAGLVQLVAGLKRRDPWRIGIVAMGVTFLLCNVFTMRWSPWRGRYFVLAATIVAPLGACLYRPGRIGRAFAWGVCSLAVLALGCTTVSNEAKPLLGARTIWNSDRIRMRAYHWDRLEPRVRLVENNVPADATLGILIGGNDWDYPMFGSRFERKVVVILPTERLADPAWLAQRGIEFAVVDPELLPAAMAIPAGLRRIGEGGGWRLYRCGETP